MRETAQNDSAFDYKRKLHARINITMILPTYLEDGEVLENAVHHVLLWQVLQFVDEIYHILAHR